ncbi:MAG: hypothetical protein JXR19_04470 [Bacteroidia bacterium]
MKEVVPVVSQITEEVQEEVVPDEKLELKPISAESLSSRIAQLADDIFKQGRKGLASYLKDPLYDFTDSQTTFKVGSKTLKNELEDTFTKLQRNFASEGVQWDFIVEINAQAVNEYKLFTPKQQFDALAKEYPPLKEFEQRFGLDFDV